MDARRGILAVVHLQRVARASRRARDTQVGQAAERRVREAARVAYVAAKEASQDPRAVALASTAAVVLAMAWVAYATHDPVSDEDVRRALKYHYAPRRAYRLVRRVVGSQKELGAYLAERHPCEPAIPLLEAVHSSEQLGLADPRVPLCDLLQWLAFAAAKGGNLEALEDLHQWAHNTSMLWSDGITDKAFVAVSKKVSALADKLDKMVPPTITEYLRGVAGDLFPQSITDKRIMLTEEGSFVKPLGGLNVAIEYLGAIRTLGVPIASLDAYCKRACGTTLRGAIERSILNATQFPRRSAAAMMRAYAQPDLTLEGAEPLSVDETEPHVQASQRLNQAMFDSLETAETLEQLVRWATRSVGVICARKYDQRSEMRYVIGALSAKVRSVCAAQATRSNVDDMVYLALAIRVLGRSATMQFPDAEHAEEVRTWVFAAVVRVALRAAELAKKELGVPDVTPQEKQTARDLNLFFEPSNVADKELIDDYNKLCGLLYDEFLLLYVAPGIEHDANYLADTGNPLAGAGLTGRYSHEIPAASTSDTRRPDHAPYYLGGGTWAGLKVASTMHAMKSLVASLVPTALKLATARMLGAHRATIAIWLLMRISANRRLSANVKAHSLKSQREYLAAMLANTPYRALNVACAALTAQDTHPRESPSSVMHMLDSSTGYVRITLDFWAPTAGMDVAPPRVSQAADGPLFGAERVMPHFSRGHYATATEERAKKVDPRGWVARLLLPPPKYGTARVVGTPASLAQYAKRQAEYDREIYDRANDGTPQIALSLAARQFKQDLPESWLAPSPDKPPKPSVAQIRSVYFVAETTATPTLISAVQTASGLTAQAGGLPVTVQTSITGMRVVHKHEGREWAFIVNPASAIRVQPDASQNTRDPMMRLLIALSSSEVPDFGVWSNQGQLMLTVPDPAGTLRVFTDRGEVVALRREERYTVTTRYTPWSSLFFSHIPGDTVHLHARTEDDEPCLLCITRQKEDSTARVHVLALLHSSRGLAPEQSIPPSQLTQLLADLAPTPCRTYVQPLYELLSAGSLSEPVPADERVLVRHVTVKYDDEQSTMQGRWTGSLRHSYNAALRRVTKAGEDPVARRLAQKRLEPFASTCITVPAETSRALVSSSPGDTKRREPELTELENARVRFEAATGKCVTEAQMETARLAMESFQRPDLSEIIPAVMGSGKSAVIIPMLALYAALYRTRVVIVVVPPHLVSSMYFTIAVALTQGARKIHIVMNAVVAAPDPQDPESKVVCVLSAHRMQQITLESPKAAYSAGFRANTTMIFDEIDGLMDPLQCVFRRSSGAPKPHYLNIDLESYRAAVVAAVRGESVPEIRGAESAERREQLRRRIIHLSAQLKVKRVRRDFGLAQPANEPLPREGAERQGSSAIYAVPLTRGVLESGMHFSDVDVCAILTARLFVSASPGDAVYTKAALPQRSRENAARLASLPEDEACARIAMSTIQTFTGHEAIAFVDIACMCDARVAFSGTVDIPCVLPINTVTWVLEEESDFSVTKTYGWHRLNSGTEEQPACDTGARAEFESVIERAASRGAHFIASTDTTQAEALALLAGLVAEGVRCVVDACGLFAGTPANYVATAIIGSTNVTAVYTDETSKLRNGGCHSACMYYFNQQNSRGTDMKMRGTIKGIVIIRDDDDTATLTDTAQAAYRMRLVNERLEDPDLEDPYIHSFQFLVIGNTSVAEAERSALPERNAALARAKQAAAAGLLQRLKENEIRLAMRRRGLHSEQTTKFASRVDEINKHSFIGADGITVHTRGWSGPSYEEHLTDEQIGAMLAQHSEHHVQTSTSTATSRFLASDATDGPCEEIESSWYPPFRDMRNAKGATDHTRSIQQWLGFVTGLKPNSITDLAKVESVIERRVTPLAAFTKSIAIKALTAVGIGALRILIDAMMQRRQFCDVGHYTSESNDSAILDPVGGASFKTNMQRVVHLAQNGALFHPTSEYASSDANKQHVPMTPPATALLYTFMGHAQSTSLERAIQAFSETYGRLQVTTRLFLCHARILPKHCVVVVHGDKPEFVLATCADLLLAEVRALRSPRVYFHGTGEPVQIRDMSLKPVDDQPLPAALYLLASVGAILDRESQEKVREIMRKLDDGNGGLMTVTFRNKHSATRLSEKNAWLDSRLLYTYNYQGPGSFGKPPKIPYV